MKLFIEAEKLTPEVYKHLQASATVSVSVHPYTDFNAHLGMLSVWIGVYTINFDRFYHSKHGMLYDV